MNSPGGSKNISRISVIGNMFATNYERFPNVGGNGSVLDVELINNIGYQWKSKATAVNGTSTLHMIGNSYVPGPNTSGVGRAVDLIGEGSMTYSKGNNATFSIRNEKASLLEDDKGAKPLFTPSGYVDVPLAQLDSVVGDRVGVFPRDAVDERVISDYRTRRGQFIYQESEVGGYPTLKKVAAPLDTDGDGMPDAWEVSRGLKPSDPSDAHADRNGDGYSNIEEYINSFFDADGIYR